MMVGLLYSFLLVGTAAGVGLTAVVGWLNIKLYQIDHQKNRKSLGLLLAGVLVQNAILVFALIDSGTATPNFQAALFALGLAVTTAGLAWKAGQFVADLALAEALRDGHHEE